MARVLSCSWLSAISSSGCDGGTRLCGGRRPGSTPGGDTVILSEPNPRRSVLNSSPTACRDYIPSYRNVSATTSLGNLRNKTDCPIGVHALQAGDAGSNPTGTSGHRCAVAQWQSTVTSLISSSSVSCLEERTSQWPTRRCFQASRACCRTDTYNEAGGRAYSLEPKHALAQLAATGCFNGTYYAGADQQLATLKTLIDQVDDNTFLAKLAVYSRERAMMKDMPVALLVALSKRDPALFRQVFDRVVDNGRTLRTLVQFVRSGQFGRKSLSYSLQRAVQRWLNAASVEKLLSASIGNDPSLRDVLRLARPTPPDNARRALFGWLTDKPIEKWRRPPKPICRRMCWRWPPSARRRRPRPSC